MKRLLQNAALALRGRWLVQAGLWLVGYMLLFGLTEGATYLATDRWLTYTTDNSPLQTNYIRALAADEHGAMWIGTPDGLYRLDAGGAWQAYTPANSQLSDRRILALAVDHGGQLWVGTENGLDVLTPEGRWHNLIAPSAKAAEATIRAIAVDSANRAWVGSYTTGLWLFEANTLTAVHPYTETGQIWALAVDGQDNVWVGAQNGLHILGADGEWTTYRADRQNPGQGLVENWVSGLWVDHDQRVWVGTMRSGLSIRAPEGSWMAYTASLWAPRGMSMFTSGQITALTQDGQGRHWVGTRRELTVIDTDGRWTIYTPGNSGLPDDVRALAVAAPGHLWVGTEAGLSVLDVRSHLPGHLPDLWILIRTGVATPITLIRWNGNLIWELLVKVDGRSPGLKWPFGVALAFNLAAVATLFARRSTDNWRHLIGPLMLFLITALFMAFICVLALADSNFML